MKRLLRHLFVPHHSNNFKPRILHTHILYSYAVFFLLFSSFLRIGQAINPDILGYATNITIDSLMAMTNQKRAENGLAPLTYNATLAQAAAGKASDMFGGDYWAHNSPNGKTPWDFIIGAGYSYSFAGENLAKNFSDSSGVVEAWMNSPTHRENILRSQYTEVGFAVVNGRLQGEETTLVVQMFGAPRGRAVVNSAQASDEVQDQVIIETNDEPDRAMEPVDEEPEVASDSEKPVPMDIVEVPPMAAGVVRNPTIDIGSLTKRMALVLSGLVIATFVIDGIYVWRKKIVRISGKNLAHILFLSAITGIIWLASTGSILDGLHI